MRRRARPALGSRSLAWLLGAVLVIVPGRGAAQRPKPANVIFTGSFITLDPALPRAKAIAVRGDTIVAVGTRAQVESLASKTTKWIALRGVTVPGLIDAHVHPDGLGELLESIDLRALSKAEVVQRVRRAAAAAPPGAWIRGSGWDQAYWRPPTFPTASDIDSVSGDHPVVLDRIDGHAVWANARALRLAGVTRDVADAAGGRIVRDESGDPTGVLVDHAIDLVTRAALPPSAADRERRLRAALAQYARWGLTGVHDAGATWNTLELYRGLAARGELPVRVYAMASASDSTWRRALDRGPEIGLGGGMLTVRSVKVVLDGALGSRGAELSAPYADAPEGRGLVLTTDARLDTIVRAAVARGFQVNAHAIGDAATHRMLDAFERFGEATSRLRFRDEHVSMVRDEDVSRFVRLGVVASMQPVFVGEYSRFAEDRVGKERLPWVYRTRDLLSAGATIASGTDYPASDAGDPVSTLYSMVTRRGPDGTPSDGWLPDQRASVDDALRSMTQGAAWASFDDRVLGAIAVGRLADMTVLSADPYAVAPAELRTLRVLRTIVGGRTTYEAPRRPPARRGA